jgi:hypothetical protein
MMALAVATPALAGTVTIAVKSPEGLSIKISTSKSGRTDSVSRNGLFVSGHYLATFSKTAPFYCATVATVGWEIVFPEGATAKRVCYPANRLKQATVGGKGVLVLTANYQKH